jgi:integral membrane protein
MLSTPIGRLRAIGMLEGTSFLLLLGVAMPLKYLAGMPLAVKIVGWIHGLLFVLFCAALVHAMRSSGLSWYRASTVFVAALLPFGPFVIDKKLRDEAART